MSPKLCLSIAVKAVNNTAGLNSLVLTLLVFNIYLRISEISLLSLGIIARAIAIHKAIKELSNIRAHYQIKDTLVMQNGLNVAPILQLSLNNDIII